MGNDFILSYRTACQWWLKPELGSKPENMEQVAEVLYQAGIEVSTTTFNGDGWLVCEPYPDRIYEALSGGKEYPYRSYFGDYCTQTL